MASSHAGDPAAARFAMRRDTGPGTPLRHLRLIGIVLPVLFIVAVELLRTAVIDHWWPDHGHLFLGGLNVLAVLAFGSTLFFFIDRVHRIVLRQNRELAAVSAVSMAVRDHLDLDQVVDAALRSILASSGAVAVTLTASMPGSVPADDLTKDQANDDQITTWRRTVAADPSVHGAVRGAVGGGASTAGDGDTSRDTGDGATIDIPLLAGTMTVGTMSLRLPAGGEERLWLGSDTLRTIGQQVGSAIQRSRLIADLHRRRREDHAIYRLLLTISSQDSPTSTLASVIGTAGDLLGADLAGMCLNHTTAGLVSMDVTSAGGSVPGRPVCITDDGARACDDCAAGCPVRTRSRYPALISAPLRGPWGNLGTIWLARRSSIPFSGRDESFLVTLSELAVVALNHARMLEHERQGATLAERERIARELHDSLAQVLGVVQLRLRALTSRHELSGASAAQSELADLIGMCQEAYHDVREAILGLRESSRADRALLESLRAYVEKLSRQSRIEITLATTLDRELTLTPQCEVQVIRVIQEALTNVRKHSGARSAVVRISESPDSTTFVVEDDGCGFDPDGVPADREGFGLHSMCERIKLINGEMTIDSEPGRGTRVIVEVPASHRMAAGESAAPEDWSALLGPRRLRPVYGTPQSRPRFPRMKAFGI